MLAWLSSGQNCIVRDLPQHSNMKIEGCVTCQDAVLRKDFLTFGKIHEPPSRKLKTELMEMRWCHWVLWDLWDMRSSILHADNTNLHWRRCTDYIDFAASMTDDTCWLRVKYPTSVVVGNKHQLFGSYIRSRTISLRQISCWNQLAGGWCIYWFENVFLLCYHVHVHTFYFWSRLVGKAY